MSRPPKSTAWIGVLLLVLLIFWFFIRPRYGSVGPEHATTAVRAQLSGFKVALDRFHIDTGDFPRGTNGLFDLTRRPQGSTNWQGPYLDSIPKDPWGQDYLYDYPSKHTNLGWAYDLGSPGPPGKNSPLNDWSRPK